MQEYIAELEALLEKARAANHTAATIRVAAELERVRNGGDTEKRPTCPEGTWPWCGPVPV